MYLHTFCVYPGYKICAAMDTLIGQDGVYHALQHASEYFVDPFIWCPALGHLNSLPI